MNKTILTSVVIVLVAVIGVVAFTSDDGNDGATDNTSTTSEQVVDQSDSQGNESDNNSVNNDAIFTNASTCSNEDENYSFQYPSDWYRYSNESMSETTLTSEAPCADGYVFVSPLAPNASGDHAHFLVKHQTIYELGVSQYEGVDSLEGYLIQNPDLPDDINNYATTTVDGREFIWVQEFPNAPHLIDFANEQLITIRGNQSVSGEMFNKILSTFTFTN